MPRDCEPNGTSASSGSTSPGGSTVHAPSVSSIDVLTQVAEVLFVSEHMVERDACICAVMS